MHLASASRAVPWHQGLPHTCGSRSDCCTGGCAACLDFLNPQAVKVTGDLQKYLYTPLYARDNRQYFNGLSLKCKESPAIKTSVQLSASFGLWERKDNSQYWFPSVASSVLAYTIFEVLIALNILSLQMFPKNLSMHL